MRTRLSITVICLVAALALAAPAFAQDTATQDTYSGLAAQQLGGTGGGGPGGAVESTSSSGSLPFTGLQLGLIALVGVGLLGGGLAIRRLSRGGPSPA